MVWWRVGFVRQRHNEVYIKDDSSKGGTRNSSQSDPSESEEEDDQTETYVEWIKRVIGISEQHMRKASVADRVSQKRWRKFRLWTYRAKNVRSVVNEIYW